MTRRDVRRILTFSTATGKVIREGMGQATNRPDSETLDCIIMNALVVDWSGIYKVRLSLLSGRRSSTFR